MRLSPSAHLDTFCRDRLPPPAQWPGFRFDLPEPSLALCDHRFAADLAAGAPGLTIIRYGGDGPDDLAARCAAKDGTFTPVDTAADDVAMLASTSGTTGQPKVTIHFHRDVLATADTFSARLIKPVPD